MDGHTNATCGFPRFCQWGPTCSLLIELLDTNYLGTWLVGNIYGILPQSAMGSCK